MIDASQSQGRGGGGFDQSGAHRDSRNFAAQRRNSPTRRTNQDTRSNWNNQSSMTGATSAGRRDAGVSDRYPDMSGIPV